MLKQILIIFFITNPFSFLTNDFLNQDSQSLLEKFLSKNTNLQQQNKAEEIKSTDNSFETQTDMKESTNLNNIGNSNNNNKILNNDFISNKLNSIKRNSDQNGLNQKEKALYEDENSQNIDLTNTETINSRKNESSIIKNGNLPDENVINNFVPNSLSSLEKLNSSKDSENIEKENESVSDDLKNLEGNLISTIKSLRNTKNYKQNTWEPYNREIFSNNNNLVGTMPETERRIPTFAKRTKSSDENKNENEKEFNENKNILDNLIFGNISEILVDFSSKARNLKKKGKKKIN